MGFDFLMHKTYSMSRKSLSKVCRHVVNYWCSFDADSEEKREPVSDINVMAVGSLKALDPNRPSKEADIA